MWIEETSAYQFHHCIYYIHRPIIDNYILRFSNHLMFISIHQLVKEATRPLVFVFFSPNLIRERCDRSPVTCLPYKSADFVQEMRHCRTTYEKTLAQAESRLGDTFCDFLHTICYSEALDNNRYLHSVFKSQSATQRTMWTMAHMGISLTRLSGDDPSWW